MSKISPKAINCPFCNESQVANIYDSVNVTIDPSLKQKVLNGTLNDKNCDSCGKAINIISGLLYHDMTQKLMISLNTSDEPGITFDNKNPFLKMEGYIVREVKEYYDLIEKITIFDNGLNDEVLAALAEGFSSSLNEIVKDAKLYVFFDRIEKSLFKKKIVFKCFTHPSQMMELKQPISKLDKAQQSLLFNMDVLRN
ncbi:CpXC domain-containing protein [Flavobacterium sp. RHBU_3]|uniref:CpXC domain-containing protein n=1 Tax=Flavobacterium sp. RHBU_3 TaxID=3391184 RepID=UPI0039851374